MITNALYPQNLAKNCEIVFEALRRATHDARYVEFNYELADQIFQAGLTDVDFIQVLIIMRWTGRVAYTFGIVGEPLVELLPEFWTRRTIDVS